MTSPLTMLLRLRAESARDGAVVGHVEVIETGEVVAVKNAGDLSSLIQRLAGPPHETG
jgi:hypothetical protein